MTPDPMNRFTDKLGLLKCGLWELAQKARRMVDADPDSLRSYGDLVASLQTAFDELVEAGAPLCGAEAEWERDAADYRGRLHAEADKLEEDEEARQREAKAAADARRGVRTF